MLLTRAPLRPKPSFDLHVLGMPPAFVLSQDQTLRLNFQIVSCDTTQSPAPIRLHYITWLTKDAQPKRRVFPHAAACASLPIPTMSNNRPLFFTAEPLVRGRRRRQRRQAFTLAAEPSQPVFCIFSFLFSSLRSASMRGFRQEGPGRFPWSETKCRTRVVLIPFPDFSRHRLAFRRAPSRREAAYTSARRTESTNYFEKNSAPSAALQCPLATAGAAPHIIR